MTSTTPWGAIGVSEAFYKTKLVPAMAQTRREPSVTPQQEAQLATLGEAFRSALMAWKDHITLTPKMDAAAKAAKELKEALQKWTEFSLRIDSEGAPIFNLKIALLAYSKLTDQYILEGVDDETANRTRVSVRVYADYVEVHCQEFNDTLDVGLLSSYEFYLAEEDEEYVGVCH